MKRHLSACIQIEQTSGIKFNEHTSANAYAHSHTTAQPNVIHTVWGLFGSHNMRCRSLILARLQ